MNGKYRYLTSLKDKIQGLIYLGIFTVIVELVFVAMLFALNGTIGGNHLPFILVNIIYLIIVAKKLIFESVNIFNPKRKMALVDNEGNFILDGFRMAKVKR